MAIGATINALILVGRMWGKEKSDWQDRRWNLLVNNKQKLEDWWGLGSAGLGAGAAVAVRSTVPIGYGIRLVGGMGLGAVIGAVGVMIKSFASLGENGEVLSEL